MASVAWTRPARSRAPGRAAGTPSAPAGKGAAAGGAAGRRGEAAVCMPPGGQGECPARPARGGRAAAPCRRPPDPGAVRTGRRSSETFAARCPLASTIGCRTAARSLASVGSEPRDRTSAEQTDEQIRAHAPDRFPAHPAARPGARGAAGQPAARRDARPGAAQLGAVGQRRAERLPAAEPALRPLPAPGQRQPVAHRRGHRPRVLDLHLAARSAPGPRRSRSCSRRWRPASSMPSWGSARARGACCGMRCRRAHRGQRAGALLELCLLPQSMAEMSLPCRIGEFTDFYTGIHHATAVGKLYRPENPLLPNYKWVPIAHHGRASSIGPSGHASAGPRASSGAAATTRRCSARRSSSTSSSSWAR